MDILVLFDEIILYMEFTVATWNIAGARPIRSSGIFDYAPEDIDYFVGQLKGVNPDFVCLQEAHRNEHRSIAMEIAKKLGNFHYVESSNSASHIDPKYQLGNAVLSRKKLVDKENYTFPYPKFPLVLPDGRPAAHYDKGFQVMQTNFCSVINLQVMPIRFLGTPYASPQGQDFARTMEDMLLSNKTTPLLICGDFNHDNARSLYPTLLGDMRSALPVTPTRPDGKRTDYIFYSSEFALLEAGVVETKSDHYMCWARFEM